MAESFKHGTKEALKKYSKVGIFSESFQIDNETGLVIDIAQEQKHQSTIEKKYIYEKLRELNISPTSQDYRAIDQEIGREILKRLFERSDVAIDRKTLSGYIFIANAFIKAGITKKDEMLEIRIADLVDKVKYIGLVSFKRLSELFPEIL
jgi:hypothetical protein